MSRSSVQFPGVIPETKTCGHRFKINRANGINGLSLCFGVRVGYLRMSTGGLVTLDERAKQNESRVTRLSVQVLR